MRRFKHWLLATTLLLGVASVPGCHISPSVSMGVGVDYYGGSFHARPYGNVGFYGHP